MEEENLLIVDWKIENFSFWREEMHETLTSSRLKIFSSNWFEVNLHPKGCCCNNKDLMVSITEIESGITGDLFFIGSDGSVLYTLPLDVKANNDKVIQLPPGPPFKDVIDHIKKNEAFHEDQLTLSFRFRTRDNRSGRHVMSTAIDGWKTSLKINPSMSMDNEPKRIFSYNEVLMQMAVKHEKFNFTLELNDTTDENPFLVETCAKTVSGDTLVGYEEKSHLFVANSPWTFSDSLETKLLADGGIALFLRLKVIKGSTTSVASEQFDENCVTVDSKEQIYPAENSVAVLTKDFLHLYEDQNFSDFKLRCGTRLFPVHKGILCARSPIFRCLLSNDMQEAVSGVANIVDLDPSTLSRFLTFLYSGTLNKDDVLTVEEVHRLYYAADKYQVDSLKKECVRLLRASISVSNVLDVLNLALKHSDQELAAMSHAFILNNFIDFLRSPEWTRFALCKPAMALKVVTNFAVKDWGVEKTGF